VCVRVCACVCARRFMQAHPRRTRALGGHYLLGGQAGSTSTLNQSYMSALPNLSAQSSSASPSVALLSDREIALRRMGESDSESTPAAVAKPTYRYACASCTLATIGVILGVVSVVLLIVLAVLADFRLSKSSDHMSAAMGVVFERTDPQAMALLLQTQLQTNETIETLSSGVLRALASVNLASASYQACLQGTLQAHQQLQARGAVLTDGPEAAHRMLRSAIGSLRQQCSRQKQQRTLCDIVLSACEAHEKSNALSMEMITLCDAAARASL
jgi:hypothetical protein